MPEKIIELFAWTQNPSNEVDIEDAPVCGALGCFSEDGSDTIHTKERTKPGYEQKKETIFRETSGRGHGAVLDQAEFIFSIDNLSRASTLFLCGPQYAAHLQQSLRRATAKRGFHLPNQLANSPAEGLMRKQFSLYEQMQNAGIPSEDARFILPLFTLTTIQSKWDARELMHLHSMAQRMNVPDEVRDTVEQMYAKASQIAPRLMKDRGTNYEVLSWLPSPQLFASENRGLVRLIEEKGAEGAILVDSSGRFLDEKDTGNAVLERDEAELANLKHYHFTFLASMSLSTFHQATRQRTWDQSVEPIPNAVQRASYTLPESIGGTEFETPYRRLTEHSIDYVGANLEGVQNTWEYCLIHCKSMI
jgi:thymidylate synthase ThyX